MNRFKNQAKLLAVAAALSATMLTARILPALACAALAPDPKDEVNVVDESAIIIWDAAKKREHFIRGATFESSAKDIGFIVPTPSTPELSSARREAFGILEKALEPKVERRVNRGYVWSIFGSGRSRTQSEELTATTSNTVENATSDAPEKPRRTTTAVVRVLQTRQVAGYDATTLKADDVGALSRWLNKNGYILTSDFRDWLKPYVRDGWVVTAFKIRKQNKNQKQFSSSLVRMSFDAEKPFYPYREPASARKNKTASSRSLRVFFIGDERVSGAIGENSQRNWPGKAQWSDKLNDHLDQSQRANLAQQLAINPKQFSARARLTSFEDFSSPRPGFDEVYFSPSANQEKILPKPLIIEVNRYTYIPLDLIAILAIIAFFIGRAIVGRKKARLAPTLSKIQTL